MRTAWADELAKLDTGCYIYPMQNQSALAIAEFVDTSGETYYGRSISSSNAGYNATKSMSKTGDSGIGFGSGNTPVTENDYCLESPITTGFSASVSTQGSIDVSKNESYNDKNITITNTSNSDIVIKEVGRFVKVSCNSTKGNSSSSSDSKLYLSMIDRTVLDTPITIAPQESVVIRYRMVTKFGQDS